MRTNFQQSLAFGFSVICKVRFFFIGALVSGLLAFDCSVFAGSITGRVIVEIPSNNKAGSDTDEYDSRRYKFLEKVDYSKFRDFIVSIEGADVALEENDKRPQAAVSQKNGRFVPRILAISKGTEVSWPNRDAIFHNVFSMSETESFDLGYYKNTDEPKKIVFDKTGRVDVFCSIHADMTCVVLVLPNPWFAKTDKKGEFTIEGIPAGSYRLKVWHERLPVKHLDVVVDENADTEVEIAMGFGALPKI
ncbi:carboxypeptidase regulatory-like domain-containing protein [Puniceicoccaceae bacterium K14]|nr:carboxypeptidase regulatory-like domain-containing protein [Puniceicoccaceae bacterium K14]